jgi:Mrp family chromosome partitioning ATPase
VRDLAAAGSIPHAKSNGAPPRQHAPTADELASQWADLTAPASGAFDALASRIDSSGVRMLGFTSALSGEGVSTVALGTALALASLRRDAVLLVDANWVQPSLTGDAHLGSAPGLADCLASDATVAAAARPGARARLWFLPVGDRQLARPSLRALESFVAEGLDAFGAVVVDLPALLPAEHFVVPWPPVLDQLFVVLRDAATPLALVRQALAKLGSHGAAQLVLNRAAAHEAHLRPRDRR